MKDRKLSDYSVTRVATKEYRSQPLDKVDFPGQELDHLRFFDFLDSPEGNEVISRLNQLLANIA